MTSTATFHLIRHAHAAKLGANSSGEIQYAVLTNADRSEHYLALTGNTGGSGYFSREAVAITTLQECAQTPDQGRTLAARDFKRAFVGRSSNNSYFIVAVLVAEGLINRLPKEGPGRGQPLADAGAWDDWTAATTASVREAGDGLPVFPLGKATAPSEEQDAHDDQDTQQEGQDPASEASAASTEGVPDIEPTHPENEDPPATGKARRKAKARA